MSTPRSALFCTHRDCAAAKLHIFSRFCKKLSTFYFPGNKTRLIGQKNFLALHTMLSASLSVSKCSPVLCPPLFLARLAEWRNLPIPHTALHPNDRAAEPVSSAHSAGNWPARGKMLAQFVLAARAASVCCAQHLLRGAIPEWRDGKICQFHTRSRQSICQKAHALPFSARRFSSPD